MERDAVLTLSMTPLMARLAEIITPSLDGMGYELVSVQMIGGNKGETLQIMADRQDGKAITVDDCADISRVVSALLDVNDPISGAYTLEVSSPGIDRPLVREKDFANWAGFDAKIEMATLQDGRRRYRGKLLGIEDGLVRLQVGADSADNKGKRKAGKSASSATGDAVGDGAGGEIIELRFTDIAKAKLILTDALLAAAVAQMESDTADETE